ncbi:MAG: prepilin-type N-terminal cleavage/methylation domain-containing protein, partial [Methyloprofundus sp.]|nr:prepilin-type N-terminal cleavage/methylation domain-containing protein [Methyloprofundus sp.]
MKNNIKQRGFTLIELLV